LDTWIDIRRKARACHEAALKKANGNRHARAIVDTTLENEGLEIRYFDPGTVFSDGVVGSFDRGAGLVNVANGQDPRAECVVIAHEIGHSCLHLDPTSEVTAAPIGLGGDPIEGGGAKVEGYSPRERKEVQADIFAGELLCPTDWLRAEYLQQGHGPARIAKDLGLPVSLVVKQMIRALLLPPLRVGQTEEVAAGPYELDDSQKAAATWNGGSLLVDAGPGTGKTRTLIHRIKHLLDAGTLPGTILALTFSNKAAEEMRERLSGANPQAAIELPVGTFHAFGLELITKWPSATGRSGNVRILDEAGSLALLEDNLEKLPLRHYQNLYEPAYELVHVLRAISRCKDELISPGQYLAEAQAALAAAQATSDDERIEAAEKTIEIAGIYRVYEEALKAADAVDFGDLVMLATKLVIENADVQRHIAKFKHVLVDEYQDVNLASARLLQAIAQFGAKVWVVADKRQSIYRFRGAEPSNVSRFATEFTGTRRSLAQNYRSYEPVVRTFAQFSASMGGGGGMTGSWQATRADGGEVTLTTAPTLSAEAEAIRDKIEEFREKGIAYSDQVILARTHLTLSRVTGVLEQLGVPLLYLGDLFERGEIRDLLSLLALGVEQGDVGLTRLATIPAYQATRQDALVVLAWARASKRTIFEALASIEEIDELTDQGREGLNRLGRDIEGLEHTSPWTFLTTWLFERSEYLRPLLEANTPSAQQRLIAIYHLVKVCGEQASAGDTSRKAFLAKVRRLEALNQDSSYRNVASEAADMDAVRVMSIHGSKGLEFGAVHFPALATRYMPTSRQPNRCPPPPTLPQLAMQGPDHDAEEECLFFVGLSRARDFLSLSRADRYTSQNASPSKFLGKIAGVARVSPYNGSGKVYAESQVPTPPPPRARYLERELSLYTQCPLRFKYEVVDGLRGGRDESPYLQFHRCVYATIGWMERQREAGTPVSHDAALEKLEHEWATRGPIGGFEAFYKSAASSMVQAMADAIAHEDGQYDREEWIVPIRAHEVAITPDRVLVASNGAICVQRVRTGRKTKSEADNAIYALLRRGAAIRYPGARTSVETFYLATGERTPMDTGKDDKQLQQYGDAIEAIERGEFPKKLDARRCPNCPSYFICGT
jgi:superfamily I DNA/RNA helicase/Zn-dependent peptidase ImmA (M78 family)